MNLRYTQDARIIEILDFRDGAYHKRRISTSVIRDDPIDVDNKQRSLKGSFTATPIAG